MQSFELVYGNEITVFCLHVDNMVGTVPVMLSYCT